MYNKILKTVMILSLALSASLAFSIEKNSFVIVETNTLIKNKDIKLIDMIGTQVNFIELKSGQIFYGDELKKPTHSQMYLAMNTTGGG